MNTVNKADVDYPSWVEESMEHSMRVKAIHIGGILAREQSTNGVLEHIGHYIPTWQDKPFPSFPNTVPMLSMEQETVRDWLATHKPRPMTRGRRAIRLPLSEAFPIDVAVAKAVEPREGSMEAQAAYEASLKTVHGVSGGPARTWMDKLKGF